MLKKSEYLHKKYKRIKRYLRFRLGVQQLIFKPYLNSLFVAVLVGFILFWKEKSDLYSHTPKLILPIWRSMVHILGISVFYLYLYLLFI